MYKSIARAVPRQLLTARTQSSRRFLSMAPPHQKSRSWKSSAARWTLAAGGVYYYNTSDMFAEEPEEAIQNLDESIHRVQESESPTIDAIIEEKRQRYLRELKSESATEGNDNVAVGETEGERLDDLEEEAGQQGAFNPETGEINWDCPCLGGMAHGPCGEEFKAAFSCFVYSTEEPKGVECIDKFKGMQDCFRLHPEMYGSELEDDEDEVEAELALSRETKDSTTPQLESLDDPEPSSNAQVEESIPETKRSTEVVEDIAKTSSTALSIEADEPVPKAAHDAT